MFENSGQAFLGLPRLDFVVNYFKTFVVETDRMIETGKILQQRYRIDKQIGQGGMGAVFLATDERFGSTVAIKETLCMDDNYRKAIEREARLLNSLKHTALPRVTDHFLEENGQFLVMEYIPGEDLAFMLERDAKPFPVEQVLEWADQLLDALDFLHNQQNPVIHRDIKPQNLKITARGQIILLDFGLAKGNPTDAGHQTAAKSIFGYSRNYASLEQIQGTGTDPRSDLYSLGATLYHLATGQPPEDALTRAMSVLNRQPDPLLPAHQVRTDIPKGLSGILQNALDLNAATRPQSALQMRQMFREYSNYEHLAAEARFAQSFVTKDIFEQETNLKPGATQQATDRQSGIATELLPAYVSQVTSLRTDGVGQNTEAETKTSFAGAPRPAVRRKRTFAIAAASAAAILIAGSAAAGVLLYSPAFFGSGNGAESSQEQVVPANASPLESGGTAEQPAIPPTTAPLDQPVNPETRAVDPGPQAIDREPVDRKTKTTDTAKRTRPMTEQERQDSNGDTFELDDHPVDLKNVKITRGRVKNPEPDSDDDDIKVTKMPSIFRQRGLPPELDRVLTPAQRRKMRIVTRGQDLIFPEGRKPQ